MSDQPSYERIEDLPGGQYVAYTFYKVDPAWRRLPVDERAAGKDAFSDVVEEWAGRMEGLRTYTTTGVRPDADFFLWKITERYEDLLELGAALNGTPLAGLVGDPALVPCNNQAVGLHRQEACAPGACDPAQRPVPGRLPVRQEAAVVLPSLRGAGRGDEPACGDRSKFVTVTNHTTYCSGSTTRSSCPRSSARSRPTSCT